MNKNEKDIKQEVSALQFVDQGIYQKGSKSLAVHELFNYQLGRSLNGVSDVITIVATSNGTSTKVVAALGWYEL